MHEREEQLINFYRSTRRMPGYKELMKLWDFKSKNAVYKVIEKMVDAGIINKDRDGHIAPSESFNEIKMLGLVEAGIPTEAEESIAETVSIDELLVENREASYILRVKGESMIEAGIREGDIVIAEVDGGWTMKYFRRRGARIYLEPANIAMQPIYPEEELRIAAIVKAVIRKY